MTAIVVLGATGRTGKLVVEQALNRGLDVVAYVRRAGALQVVDGLRIVVGELFDPERLERAFADADAIICCLGTRNHKPPDLMQRNMPPIIEAMKRAGGGKLVLLSAYGVGETARSASLVAKVLYGTMFRTIFRDKELSEADLKRSNVNWTIIYPVGLTDGPAGEVVDVRPMTTVKKVKGLPRVSRTDVARVLLDVAEDRRAIGQKLLVTSAGSVR